MGKPEEYYNFLYVMVLMAADCGMTVDRQSGFCEKSHLVEEHNDYTSDHLPMPSCRPELESREDAKVASFAARIAFSSFAIRVESR